MNTNKEIDFRKASSETVFALKKAVIKLYKKGVKVKDIVKIIGFADQTVRNTIKKYKNGGYKALEPKKRGIKKGTNLTLSKRQQKHIIFLLTDHTPEQLKLKFCLWTREGVKQLIKNEYGIDMPLRTVGYYLQKWGFTVQRPAKQAMNQKAEQVAEWLGEKYPEIKAKAKKEKAEIFWADETAIQNVANYARGYAPRGKTPVLKIQTVKMHINMISAINNQGKLHFLLYSEAIDSERLIGFMEAIIKQTRRKVYLILDNLRTHHSKKVTEWVEVHKKRISIFYLPPYSPEYNPDEYLNNDLKRSIGTQEMVKNNQELQDNALQFMNKLKNDPEHVKKYFLHSKIKEHY